MLGLAVGYGKSLIEAKNRAIYFYNEAEGKKVFRFVETQPGKNEINEEVWVTTIWFETIEPTEAEKKAQEEKNHFIGSTDIDPNDPNWYEKWKELQADANTESMAHIADK